MNFYGADTEQLRRRARSFETCGRTMLETTATLSSAVMSVAWVGPDAEDLRQRWSELERRIRDVADRTTALGGELTEHAEEQDSASEADGGAGGSSIWDLFGMPDFPGLFNNAASRLSDWIGTVKDLAGAVAPGGPAGGNPFLAALAPGTNGPGTPGGSPQEISDLIGRLFGDGDEDEDSPFTHTPGEDSTEKFVTVTLPDGTTTTVSVQDGAVKSELTVPHRTEVTIGSKGNEITLATEISQTYYVETKPDGTKTFTFTQATENSMDAGVDTKPLDAAVGRSDSDSLTYSVTVPPGSDVGDALKVNPFDPGSIKPGYEVSIDTTNQQTTSLDVAVDGKSSRLPPMVFGGESAEGEGTTTQIARDEDGTLSVKAGPTSSDSDSAYVGIGTKDLNFSLTSSHDSASAKLEYAEFANTDAGNDAFREASRTGRLPDADSSAVSERYTETREESTMDRGYKLHAGGGDKGSVDSGSTSNTFASERITREYSNGRTEWDEQIIPRGTDEGSYARASGGTGKETEYRVHMDYDGNEIHSAARDYYDHSGSGDVDLTFTEAEVSRMRENAPAHTDYRNNTDYVASQTARSSSNSPDDAVQNMYNDYNSRGPHNPNPETPESKQQAPGRLK